MNETLTAHKEATRGDRPRFVDELRIRLAKAIWPKTIRQGDQFTVVRILRYGQPTIDGSWVGHTLKAIKVDGDRIQFAEFSEYLGYFGKPVGHWLLPGVNCELKLLKPSERKALPVPGASQSPTLSGENKEPL